ncbi:MAG: ABC transporter ATP-binding protein/permease [Candidatus Zambryskibacteria bacterium]|nr:ABC transporter ATP-binding protein/permease [Candidatus Zambryskibacteria bacterium]
MPKSQDRGVEIPSTPFAFIWYAIKPYKKWFFWSLFLVLLSDVSAGLQSYVLKMIVDRANSYTFDNIGYTSSIFLWVLAYPFLILGSVGAIRGGGFILNFLTIKSRIRATKSLFEYLSLHSLSYFNDRFSGALSEKANTVSQNISRLISSAIWNIFSFVASLVVTFVIMYSANKQLAYTFLAGIVILTPFNLLLTRRQVGLSDKAVELGAKLRGYIIDTITNIAAVQQYARRFLEISRLDKAMEEWRVAVLRSNNFREWVLVINNVIVAVFVGGIILWAFSLWSKELITIGALVMIISLSHKFMKDLSHIGQRINELMEFYGEMKNGLNEIVRPHDIIDKPNAQRLIVDEGRATFENVTFAYYKDPRLVFKDLSFEVKGGEKVGVVGTSGAGKTTLVKLLLRQHDILGGSIRIDGQDIREVTQESLRENISIVPQEPMLFHRTIRENIMYGKLDATEEEMIEVAKKAQAHDFIEQLPQKYDSMVGERGVKLSVGQRQRIAIARAFLKNAPILILDEATSALDSESEVAVQKALQALMEGKTVFAIAHRLSTLREMDRILVFKDGQIAEDGTHRTLLKNKEGVYSSFWNHQAGGFIKDE